MDRNPCLSKSVDEGVFGLVWYDLRGMPSDASVKHVEDDKLADEQQVALYLLVESVGDFYTACITWAWLGPLPTHFASLDDLGDEIKNFLGNSYSIEKLVHRVLRGMPPSYMEFSE